MFKSATRRGAIALLLFAGVVVAAGLLLYADHRRYRSDVVSQAQELLLTQASMTAQRIEQFFAEHAAAAEVMRVHPSFRSGDAQDADQTRLIEDFVQSHRDDVVSLTLLDRDGQPLAQHPASTSAQVSGHEPEAARVLSSRRTVYGPPRPEEGQTPTVTVWQPLVEGDTLIGFAVMRMNVATVYDRFFELLQLEEEACTWVIDQRGTILAHHDQGHVGQDFLKYKASRFPQHDLSQLRELLQRAMTGERGTGVFNCPVDGERLAVFVPAHLGAQLWSIGVSIGYSAIAAPVQKHLVNTLGIGSGAFLLLGLMGYRLQRSRRRTAQLETDARLLREAASAAAALKESEARYRSAIENSNDGIAVIQDERCRYANPRLARLLGVEDPEALMGERLDRFISLEDRVRVVTHARRCAEGESGPSRLEIRALRSSGEVIDVEASSARIREQGEPACLMQLRDITGQKRRDEQRQLDQNLRSLGHLAGGIAHDYNNILTSIIGYLSCCRDLAPDAGPMSEPLLQVERAAYRARSLTQRLLTFARGGAPVPRKTYLAPLLAAVVSEVSERFAARFALEVDESLPAVEVDPDQLKVALLNVLTNAGEATPAGGQVRVTVCAVQLGETDGVSLPEGEYLRLRCEDQGAGIAPEFLQEIFSPYVTSKEEGGAQGKGLGLTIAHSIVTKHSGHIEARSRPGGGAVFDIYLPLIAASTEPVGVPRSTATPNSAHVLLMDDDGVIRELSQLMLGRLGCAVTVARHGEEALRLFAQANATGATFDAVILDLSVPGGMGGLEAQRRLLELDPGVKSIVSSGYSNDPVMTDFRAHGFSGVLPKPYNIDDLRVLLREILGRTERKS